MVALHPQGRFKADSGQALVSAVLAGLGIAMLPDFFVDEHIASGALVTLLPQYPMPEAGLYVVRPPGDHPSRKVRVFTDFLVEHLAARAIRRPSKPESFQAALNTSAICALGPFTSPGVCVTLVANAMDSFSFGYTTRLARAPSWPPA